MRTGVPPVPDRDPRDGLTVSGGAGSTSAVLEDLDHAAGLLLDCAARLGVVALQVKQIGLDLRFAGAVFEAPVAFARFEAALGAVLLGHPGLFGIAAASGALGAGLRLATAAYRGVDALTAATFAQLELTAGYAIGRLITFSGATLLVGAVGAVGLVGIERLPAVLVTVVRFGGGASLGRLVQAGPQALGRSTLRLLAAAPGAGDAAVNMLPAVIAGAFGLPVLARAGARGLVAFAQHAGVARESSAVRVGISPGRRVPTARGVGDLLNATGALSPGAGAAPGSMRIDRVTRPGGAAGSRTTTWVVHVPGTQDWSRTAGRNPFDLSADAAAYTGRPTAIATAAAHGLRRLGARPGDQVLVVGHSLGGIVAARMASQPGPADLPRPTHVITAGSPVGHVTMPRNVFMMSLEHAQDPTPWLDGRPAPSEPNRVLVRADVADPLHSHDVDEYRRTADRIDTSADPVLLGARQQLAPYLDGPGVSTDSWNMVVQRTGPPGSSAATVPAVGR